MSKTNSRNSNKTISVNSNGIIISYTDSNKHQFIRYESKDAPRHMPAKYQEFEKPVFNQRQQKMYLEAMYGIKVHPDALVQTMPKRVLMKIITRAVLVQKALNKWKQEIVNQRVDNLFMKLFPESPIVKQLIGIESNDTIICKISNKDLGLNERLIAQKLVSLNLLPQNFFELK